MKKGEIGGLISKGKTVEEIQQRIKDFPSNPTIEYFITLGYKTSTARTYKSKLKKNEALKQQQKTTMEKQNKISEQEEKEENLIRSKNADENNLILDTCALESNQCISIIENSKNVYILLATIDEFDSIIHQNKSGKKFDKNFICNIRKFSRKIFEDDKKYILTNIDYNDTGYVDKKIIEYLLSLPIERRPTLITADIRLAARAKCCGIEYILDMMPLKQTQNKKTEKGKKFKVISNFCAFIKIYPNNIILESLPKETYCFCVMSDRCIELKELEEVHETMDYIVIAHKKNKRISAVKVMVSKKKIKREAYLFNSKDEIFEKASHIHPNIIEKLGNLL